MGRLSRVLRSFVIWQVVGLLVWGSLAWLLLRTSPLTPLHRTPFNNLPVWRTQELYHQQVTRDVLFAQHKDRIVDWSEPAPGWLYRAGERLLTWIAVTLPARVVPPPLHLLHLLQGPAQLQVLRTLTLLGVPDVLADKVLSLHDLHAAILANAPAQAPLLRAGLMPESAGADAAAAYPNFDTLPINKLDRLMSFALSIGYFDEISYAGSRIYTHNAQSVILRKDHPNNMNHFLFHVSNEAFLAWHNLFHAVLSPEDMGGVPAADVASRVGEDAQLGGQWATSSSQQALEDNKLVRDQAVAALRAVLSSSDAAATSPSVPTAWQRTFDSEEIWSFFKSRPSLEHNFGRAMSQLANSVNRALVQDYAWAELRGEPVDTIVDVGGAQGSFLAALLRAHPTVKRGVLLDLEGSIGAARKLWDAEGSEAEGATYAELAAHRSVELVVGNFFDATTIPLPRSRTAPTKYILRHILHDWNDRDAARILYNLRTRLQGYNAAVIIVEANLHTPETLPTRSWLDLQMLVVCNAKERKASEWDVLFRVTGWQLVAKHDTRSPLSIMELQQADEQPTVADTTQSKRRAEGQEKEDL